MADTARENRGMSTAARKQHTYDDCLIALILTRRDIQLATQRAVAQDILDSCEVSCLGP